MSIWEFLRRHMRMHGDLPAITVSDGTSVSYRELIDMVERRSVELAAAVGPGRKAAVLYEHSLKQGIEMLAGIAAGLTVIPVTLHYGMNRCRWILQDSRPDILLTDIKDSELHDCARNLGIYTDLDRVERMKSDRVANCGNPAFILYTSGTTGKPTGVQLTHENIISNLEDIAKYFALTIRDHLAIIRPLSHASAITGEFLYALMTGCRISFYIDAYSPRLLARFLAERSCTVFCTTPTMLYQMMLMNRGRPFPTVKQIVLSGECLHRTIVEQISNRFPDVRFYNVYGLTEASPRVSYLPPEYFFEKAGSVGWPLASVEIRIVVGDGKDARMREIGELLVRGPNIMDGYHNNLQATRQRIRDGWLCTGDAAYLDEDGFLYVVGRKDDMIIRGGVNIYPIEIEQVLLQHPLVREVVVVGVTDPMYGQQIHARLSADPGLTEEELHRLCREHLEPYQRPDKIQIVDRLELNATGKIIRAQPKPIGTHD